MFWSTMKNLRVTTSVYRKSSTLPSHFLWYPRTSTPKWKRLNFPIKSAINFVIWIKQLGSTITSTVCMPHWALKFSLYSSVASCYTKKANTQGHTRTVDVGTLSPSVPLSSELRERSVVHSNENSRMSHARPALIRFSLQGCVFYIW